MATWTPLAAVAQDVRERARGAGRPDRAMPGGGRQWSRSADGPRTRSAGTDPALKRSFLVAAFCYTRFDGRHARHRRRPGMESRSCAGAAAGSGISLRGCWLSNWCWFRPHRFRQHVRRQYVLHSYHPACPLLWLTGNRAPPRFLPGRQRNSVLQNGKRDGYGIYVRPVTDGEEPLWLTDESAEDRGWYVRPWPPDRLPPPRQPVLVFTW